MRKFVTLFLLTASLAAALQAAPQKSLTNPLAYDLSGVVRRPLQEAREGKKRGVVFFFVTTDCPIANRFVPEIKRIADEYQKQGIAFYIVQTDREVKVSRAKEHAKEYNFSCPVLLDRKHELVKFCGATVTPESALLSADGKVLYLGRIDDRYAELRQFRVQPKERDLRRALDETLKGKPVSTAKTKAIGCYIEG